MKPLVIYHNNCADGFGAAWATRFGYLHDFELRNCPMPEFIGGTYQTDPPDCTGRNVTFVDFCYKRPVMEQIAKVASHVLILDHHKSAMEDCQSLDELPNVRAIFDMNRSGAMMAWNYHVQAAIPPKLIEHIQDRDLWRFEMEGTKEIQAAVFSYPYEFEVWDKLMDEEMLPELYTDGKAIMRKQSKDIAELRELLERRMVIGDICVPVMNVPYMMVSEAGHEMAQNEPFAACYWDGPDTRIFGLRSTDAGADVSQVARQYGGGGHANAAGFAVPRDHELALS